MEVRWLIANIGDDVIAVALDLGSYGCFEIRGSGEVLARWNHEKSNVAGVARLGEIALCCSTLRLWAPGDEEDCHVQALCDLEQ